MIEAIASPNLIKHLLLVVLGIFAIYIWLPVSFAAFLTQHNWFKKDENALLMVAGVAPLLLAWVMYVVYLVFPLREPVFYFSFLILFLSSSLYYSKSVIVILKSIIVDSFVCISQIVFSQNLLRLSLFLTVLILFISTCFIALMYPITGNDALQYLIGSEVFYTTADFTRYPFVDTSRGDNFYAVSSHPPAFMLLHLLSSIWMWNPSETLLHKSTNVFYMFYTFALFVQIFRGLRFEVPLVAALLLLTTPFYFYGVADLSIDPLRLYAFFLSYFATVRVISNWSTTNALFAGLAIGISGFTHGLNLVLTAPIFILAYAICEYRHPVRVLKLVTSVLGFTLLFSGYQLFINYKQFGTFIYDTMPVTTLPILDSVEHNWLVNNMFSTWDKLNLGFFQGLTSIRHHGVSYIILILFICSLFSPDVREFYAKHKLYIKVGLISFLAFYLVLGLGFYFGSQNLITNPRYILTIVPLVICISSLIVLYSIKRYPILLVFLLIMLVGYYAKPSRVYKAQAKSYLVPPAIYTNGDDYQLLADAGHRRFKSAKYITNYLPADAYTIVSAQNYMRKAGRGHFIRDTHPAMYQFYVAANKVDALRYLKSMGVTHINTPSYSTPTLHNSFMKSILADPTIATVLTNYDGNKIYALLSMSREDLKLTTSKKVFSEQQNSNNHLQTPQIQVQPTDSTAVIKASIRGRGKVRVNLIQGDENSEQKVQAWNSVLYGDLMEIEAQENIKPGSQYIAYQFIFTPASDIIIETATVELWANQSQLAEHS